MEQQQVIEGNRAIMEFLQLNKCTDKEHENNPCYWHEADGEYLTASQTKYHSSWDWLMPSVKKAKELPIIKGRAIEQMNYWEYVEDMLITLDINNVFNGLIRYITWYNQNKPK